MIREVDLVSYLPPFMQKYREPVAALDAENPEFAIIWEAVDKILYNHFISTSDEYGVSRFEKLLEIKPKARQSLKERKIVIQSMANRKKMSLMELETMLAGHSPGLKLLQNMTDREIDVTLNSSAGDIRIILQLLDGIIPLDIYIRFLRRLCCYVPMCYKDAVLVHINFWPRHPLILLKLSGGWKLDGAHRLSGYDTDEYVDYYPVRTAAHILAPVPVNWDAGTSARTSVELGTDYCMDVSARSAACIRVPERSYDNVQAAAYTSVQAAPSVSDGKVQIINKLSGDWKLDGGRKLNAGIYPL